MWCFLADKHEPLTLGRSIVIPCKNAMLGCTTKVLTRNGEKLDNHWKNCPYDTIIFPNTFGKCK